MHHRHVIHRHKATSQAACHAAGDNIDDVDLAGTSKSTMSSWKNAWRSQDNSTSSYIRGKQSGTAEM